VLANRVHLGEAMHKEVLTRRSSTSVPRQGLRRDCSNRRTDLAPQPRPVPALLKGLTFAQTAGRHPRANLTGSPAAT
jgi:hypothetical protein